MEEALLWLGDVNSALSADTSSKPPDAQFLPGFRGGEYDLIGPKPDSLTTYTGRVTIRDVAGTLQITRVVDGNTEHGVIQFDIEPERVPVLRANFSMDGKSMRLHTCGDPTWTTTRE
jgi:hypothetical protein